MRAALHQNEPKATLLMLPRYRREGSLLERIVEPLGLPSLVGERQSLVHRCLSGSIDCRNDSRKNCLNVWAIRPVSKILDLVRLEN
jgi:hypothetical protein